MWRKQQGGGKEVGGSDGRMVSRVHICGHWAEEFRFYSVDEDIYTVNPFPGKLLLEQIANPGRKPCYVSGSTLQQRSQKMLRYERSSNQGPRVPGLSLFSRGSLSQGDHVLPSRRLCRHLAPPGRPGTGGRSILENQSHPQPSEGLPPNTHPCPSLCQNAPDHCPSHLPLCQKPHCELLPLECGTALQI